MGALIGINALMLHEYLAEKWKLNDSHSDLRKWLQKLLQVIYGIFFLFILYGPMLIPGVLKDLPKDQETVQTHLLVFNLAGTLVVLGSVLYFEWNRKKRMRSTPYYTDRKKWK